MWQRWPHVLCCVWQKLVRLCDGCVGRIFLSWLTLVYPCAASAAAPRPRIELSYFGSRGRAEPIRFLLEVLEVPYTDRRYVDSMTHQLACVLSCSLSFVAGRHRFQSREEWLSVKESGAFAFNQVPGLRYCPDRNTEEGCMDVVQSHTIMRFLSRKFNSYLDEEDRVWVDMVADGAEDFRSRLSKLVYSPDGPDKIKGACLRSAATYSVWWYDARVARTLPDHLETTLPQWLGFFERLKGKIHDGKKNFFVADTLTHADLYVITSDLACVATAVANVLLTWAGTCSWSSRHTSVSAARASWTTSRCSRSSTSTSPPTTVC